MPDFDAKTLLVDKLGNEADLFQLSNLILPKAKSLKAIFALEGLEADLMRFAQNPKGDPWLPDAPEPPAIDELPDDQKQVLLDDYEKRRRYWDMLKKAHEMKVSETDYNTIKNYTRKYRMTLFSTAAIKGKRFYSFTKNSESATKGGLLAKLKGGSNDE